MAVDVVGACGLLSRNSESVHGIGVTPIQWWTKWPVALLRDLSGALAAWRDLSYINLTITGWQEVELAVPPLDAQIEAAVATINMMGADRVRWRYSPVPIPLDAKNLQRLDCIAMALAQHGVTECHVRSMESNPKDKFEIPGPERRAADYSIISSVVGRYGMVAKVCREDLIAIPTAQEVRCINPKQVGACGLRTEKECGCAASMDPGQGIRCRMGCTYCYANPAVAVG